MIPRPHWYLKFLSKTAIAAWLDVKAMHLPVVGGLVKRASLPLLTGRNLNLTYLPINEEISGEGGEVLPRTVAEELIRRSSHRVIIERCTCRDVQKCENHPVELGCTLLGEGTKEIDPRIARHASVEETLEHLDRTIAEGLIPCVGRVRLDNYIWGVRNRGKLLTMCHCCRCCCMFLTTGRLMPREMSDSFVRMKGLEVLTDPGLCDGCGHCVKECFVGARILVGTESVADPALCKGCGRCAEVCPRGAVTLRIADMDAAVEEMLGRIEGLIDI